MIKTVPVLCAVLLRNSAPGGGIPDSCAIGEEDIQSVIFVIVEEGDTRPHSLQQIFSCRGRCLMLELNSKLLGYVFKFRDVARNGAIISRLLLGKSEGGDCG